MKVTFAFLGILELKKIDIRAVHLHDEASLQCKIKNCVV